MGGGVAAAAFHQTVLDVVLSVEPTTAGTLVTAAILFAWFLGSQMVLAPSGTLSVILGGIAIGPAAGVLYFIAMLIAGAAIHWLAQPDRGQAERLIRKFTPRRSWRRFARLSLRRVRKAPLAATAALRLVPVVPSAGCALALAVAGAPLRSLLLGTAAVGWLRPVAFAVFSDEVWRAIQSPSISASCLAANPAVWISALGVLAPIIILLVSDHRARSAAKELEKPCGS